jgi:long-chain acyl-CoA synthetase
VPAALKDEIYSKNPGADLKVVVHYGKGDAATKATLEEMGLKVLSITEALAKYKNDLEADTPPAATDIVTLMYTSGTTGMPKGVMLSHTNIVATVSLMVLHPSITLTSKDVHLSYLPLAHIFERQNVLALLSKGATVYFASQGAKFLLPDLSVVKPTLFAGVPKVYENVRDAVKRKMTGFKKTLFESAMKAKIADLETGCGYSPIWDKLIFSKTKAALGGRVRFCVTGGAPISKETLQFVQCALAEVVQGYGATETSAASSLTCGFDLKVGHVGPPIPTVYIRLADVPDMNYFSGPASQYEGKQKAIFDAGKNKSGGEVWIGGAGVSPGYYDPAENGRKEGVPSNGMGKKSKEDFFQADGWSWFKTGDIGSWDERGCLKIVDRKKNMFKTSLGEYVPVEEVEKTYQDLSSFADFVFLPKETKVSYVALVVVVSDSIGQVMKWAKENGIEGDEKTVVASEKFRSTLHEQLEAAAKEKKLARFMWVAKKNLHVEFQAPGYQEDWVMGVECANGHREQLLTATFKARRTSLDQYYAPIFPKIYPDRPADHILP